MQHWPIRGLVVLLTCLALLGAGSGATLAAPGGNSDDAQQCRDGWERLARQESPAVAFTNQGDCVSYAAQGGMLVPHRLLGASRCDLMQYGSGASVFAGVDLSDCDFSGFFLDGIDLSGANLENANLSGAGLGGANLSRANLWGADLSSAYLVHANLSGADLSMAFMFEADLTGANLSNATLDGANLAFANLTGANLTGIDLSEADLTDADLTGAQFSATTCTGRS